MDSLPAKPLADLEGAARRIRVALLRLAERYHREPLRFVAEARKLLQQAEPQLAEHLRAGQLLAFLKSARMVARAAMIPTRAAEPHADDHGRIPRLGTSLPLPPVAPSVYPSPVLVNIALGAHWLNQRVPFDREEFDRLDRAAQQVAFTVARRVTEDTTRRIQAKLVEAVKEGQTLTEFRTAAREVLAQTPLSPSQIETVYRTYVGRAYTAGKMRVLSHPLVSDHFPYLLYSATHDSRVRPEHKLMESLGLNGTAVYRVDDPVFDLFLPPWHYNCRCEVIPLDKETAADYGVREAMEWVETGIAPEVPEWVKWPEFRPPDGWIPTPRSTIFPSAA